MSLSCLLLKHRRAAAVFVTVWALASPVAVAAPPKKEAHQSAPPVVPVRVTAFDLNGRVVGRGCGFHTGKNGIVITVASILDKAHTATIRAAGDKASRALGIVADDKDLVLLKAGAAVSSNIPRYATETATFGTVITVIGVTTAGNPVIKKSTVTGVIAAAQGDVLQLQTSLDLDLNGCPAINSSGELVGAVCTVEKMGQHISFVIPCKRLMKKKRSPPKQLSAVRPVVPLRAHILFNAGDYTNALPLYLQAMHNESASAEDCFRAGFCLGELKHHSQAVEAYREAIRLNATMGKAWNNLGLSFAELGRLNDAATAHQKAIEINPQDIKAINNLGTVYIRLGMYQKAVAHFLHALKIDPESVEAHSNLGIAYAGMGDKGAALGQYTVLKRLNEKKAEQLFLQLYQVKQ